MTQFLVSFRGLNLSEDQVVRVRSTLEQAMRDEYKAFTAGSGPASERATEELPGGLSLPTVSSI
jgi:hypothetical protein